MSLATLIGIGLLGGAGAVARLLVDLAVSARAGRSFPYGTLVVNLSGALALGVLVGAGRGEHAYLLLGTGLVGSYTTFSTWMLESTLLGGRGDRRAAAANVAVSLALGLAAIWLGRRIGIAL